MKNLVSSEKFGEFCGREETSFEAPLGSRMVKQIAIKHLF